MTFRPFYLFQATVIGSVVIAVGIAFWVVGSPSKERARKLDLQRTNDLQQIASAIDQYYNLDMEYLLPGTLDELIMDRRVYVNSISDPRTREKYGYQVISPTTYELCASFETDAKDGRPGIIPPVPYPAFGVDQKPNFAAHGIGRDCFRTNVQVFPIPPSGQVRP